MNKGGIEFRRFFFHLFVAMKQHATSSQNRCPPASPELAMAGKRPELTGGGLIRSSGGWSVIKSLRRANIHFKSSEVITQILKESGMMNVLRTALLAILITVFTGSCSVISQQIRTDTIPPIDFKILPQKIEK